MVEQHTLVYGTMLYSWKAIVPNYNTTLKPIFTAGCTAEMVGVNNLTIGIHLCKITTTHAADAECGMLDTKNEVE